MTMKTIKDSIHKDIQLSDVEIELLDTKVMQRLRNIRQLGMASVVYPSATHTRFEHSLGVMYLAGAFGFAFDFNKKNIMALRMAGLLHDIGHLPFSHVTEDILEREFGKTHEQLSAYIVRKKLRDFLDSRDFDSEAIAKMIAGEGEYGSIFSSGVDVDKMDYLVRDSHFTGVAYGVIDLSRLISTSMFKDNTLAFDYKGLTNLEAVILSRFMMHSSVYYYHTKRAAEIMLTRAIEHAIDKGRINPKTLYEIDDVDVLSTLRHFDGYSKEIVDRLDRRDLFKVASRLSKEDLSIKQMNACLSLSNNPDKVKKIEKKMAEALKIDEGQFLIDVYPPIKSLENIKIHRKGRLYNLRELSSFSRSLVRQQWRNWNVLFCAPKEHKDKVTAKAVDIFKSNLD